MAATDRVDLAGCECGGLGPGPGGVVRSVDAQCVAVGVAVAVPAKAGLDPGGRRPTGQPCCGLCHSLSPFDDDQHPA
ncbi:hypothetical protein BHE74_00007149 [Ensete ventricosum]|nr:hypothetical protein BHE74_00007149 [Ensete ventricosum]